MEYSQSFDSLGGTVYLWSWESFVLQIKHGTYLSKNWVMENTLGNRVVVEEVTIKGKVIPGILLEYYLFHPHP